MSNFETWWNREAKVKLEKMEFTPRLTPAAEHFILNMCKCAWLNGGDKQIDEFRQQIAGGFEHLFTCLKDTDSRVRSCVSQGNSDSDLRRREFNGVHQKLNKALELLTAQNPHSPLVDDDFAPKPLMVGKTVEDMIEMAKPDIPAGWEVVKNVDGFRDEWYYLREGKWKPCHREGMLGKEIYIKQTIDIDLDKIPPEFIEFAMDKDGVWYGYTKVATVIQETWGMDDTDGVIGDYRKLVKSEHPTIHPEDWKQCKLVRPEAVNG